MDRIDRKILAELQLDATTPVAELAHRVGLSATPCWKRIRKLEDAGVIVRRTAIVDPARVGLGLCAFIEITALDHTADWRDRFLATVQKMPEIMEVFRMAGETDYLLRIIAPDMAGFNRLYRDLSETLPCKSIVSKFVMETMHVATMLPIAAERADLP
ncbi:MAG: Lrp/AsnC family transcriptional regulator [Pseudomonadota bacterium]|nr:Lrp/AsnC family transcriptional regulator [Pseudomonadota bacterium]